MLLRTARPLIPSPHSRSPPQLTLAPASPEHRPLETRTYTAGRALSFIGGGLLSTRSPFWACLSKPGCLAAEPSTTPRKRYIRFGSGRPTAACTLDGRTFRSPNGSIPDRACRYHADSRPARRLQQFEGPGRRGICRTRLPAPGPSAPLPSSLATATQASESAEARPTTGAGARCFAAGAGRSR